MRSSVLKFITLIVISLGISLLLTEIIPLSLFNSIPAMAYTPKAVYVYKKFERVLMAEGRNLPQNLQLGALIAYQRKLFIPGTPKKRNGATLGFVSQEDNQKKTDRLASAGFSNVGSTYYYPCKYRGSFTIGWKPGSKNNCPEITYGSIKKIGPAAKSKSLAELETGDWGLGLGDGDSHPRPHSEKKLFVPVPSPQSRNALLSPPKSKIVDGEETARPDEIRDYEWEEFYIGASINRHQYCSAAGKSGKGWSINLAPYAPIPGTPAKDVCQAAIDDCQRKTGDTCLVANRGDWRDYDPNRRQLSLLLKCASGKQYYRQGTGRDVYDLVKSLEKEAEKEAGATSCNLQIYSNNEVLISPDSNQRTLICTEPTEKGFAIHDLVGAVSITPPGDPKEVKTVSLQPKQSYVFVNSSDKATREELSEEQRKAILELPVVQAFLKSNNWSSELDREIEEYQKAVKDQFYKLPAPPAVQVEETVVNGVPIWKTTIDLNNPETLVSLVPKADVEKAGGLASFAKNSKAAAIASGTFKVDRRKSPPDPWTMKLGREFLENTGAGNAPDWIGGTVLGLKIGNQPEMVPKDGKQPQWEQYWFALTGHPRLVSKGIPGVTEVVPNATLDMKASVARAAIGFSSQTKTLYHVITRKGIPLAKLAEVMKAIGCDEAMNLEGGNGIVLAHKSTTQVSGEVRSPLIVVYDAQNPPPQPLREAWTSFQTGDRPSVSDR